MSDAGQLLLVEDEALLAKGIVRGITRRGLGQCVVARSVVEALASIKDGTRYTAFIVDIGLPDGSGLDVLGAARQSDNHVLTPAIVLTGSHEPRFINRATKLRARYLVKPVDMDDLAEELRDAISLAPRVELAVARLRLSHAFADILKRGAWGEPGCHRGGAGHIPEDHREPDRRCARSDGTRILSCTRRRRAPRRRPRTLTVLAPAGRPFWITWCEIAAWVISPIAIRQLHDHQSDALCRGRGNHPSEIVARPILTA